MPDTTRSKVVRSVFVHVSLGVLVKLLLVAQAILFARIFSPSQIGFLATTMLVINFVALFGRMGFEEQILRSDLPPEELLDSMFLFNLSIGVILFGAVFLAAPVVAVHFKNESLVPFIRFMGFLVFQRPLGLPKALWAKIFKFGLLKIPDLIEIVFSVGSVLVFYYVFQMGIWSLFVGRLVSFTAGTSALWLLTPHRPRLSLPRRIPREWFTFGTPLLVSGIMNYFIYQVDDIWVRYFWGEASLGYYVMAFTIPFYLKELVDLVSEVVFPVFTTLKDSIKAMEDAFSLSNEYISALVAFLGGGFCAYSHSVIVLMIGEKWVPTVPMMQLFIIAFVFKSSIGYNWGMLVMARGKSRVLMLANIGHMIFLTVGGWFAIRNFGVMGGVVLHMVHTVLDILLCRFPIIRYELGTIRFVNKVWKSLLAGTLAGLFAYFYVAPYLRTFPELIAAFAAYGVVYIALLFAMDRTLAGRIIQLVRTSFVRAGAPQGAGGP